MSESNIACYADDIALFDYDNALIENKSVSESVQIFKQFCSNCLWGYNRMLQVILTSIKMMQLKILVAIF